MSGHECGHEGHGSKIKWGAIIAGAAIAVGVALVAPTQLGQLGGAVVNIGTQIAEFIGGMFASGAGASMTEATKETLVTGARMLTGAGLIGGGAMYLMGGKKREEQAQYHHLGHQADESFAMKEDMRKMQMKMVMRAAAAGNPEAMAMMGQAR